MDNLSGIARSCVIAMSVFGMNDWLMQSLQILRVSAVYLDGTWFAVWRYSDILSACLP